MSRHRSILALCLVVAAAFCAPRSAEAQDWRTLTSKRQVTREDQLRVEIEFGAGSLKIEPSSAGSLYDARLRYDASSFEPIHTYRDGVLKLGVEGHTTRNIREGGRLDLGLGPSIPVALDLSFGAAEADLELGGLRIRSAAISTGASDTRLRFSEPNPERLTSLKLEAGAAAFRATGLGNARADRIEFEGGVGDVVLDFSGEWQGSTHVKVSMGVGALTLRIPEGVGVRIERNTFLMAFDPQGLIKRGKAYYSEDWEKSDRRLTIDLGGALGSIKVQWLTDSE